MHSTIATTLSIVLITFSLPCSVVASSRHNLTSAHQPQHAADIRVSSAAIQVEHTVTPHRLDVALDKLENDQTPVIGVDPIDVHFAYQTRHSPSADSANTISPRDGGVQPPRLSPPQCIRKAGKLHTQRQWSISYYGDNQLNGIHCGQSVKASLKSKKKCRPLTDWTCVTAGQPGYGGVTIEFHTPRTCDDGRIHDAVLQGTKGMVDVWCKHR
ncbi:hypothetical protein QBC35DRAFT_115285 [Podospora australis]|uniref:Secreted protein n=1 Tax=Podospora australis TaxID=1536484 RepID=A0AAN6WL32_9PEZI|nr:hypothetical protein QBC35DRAFT_115285 [Podospora australis]